MSLRQLKKFLPENITIILLRIKYVIYNYFENKRDKHFSERGKIFYSNFIKKNDLIFDVGANVGNRISTMLLLGARVIAIEPQKSCQLVLQAKFGNKIILIKEGLSSKIEKKIFYISNASVLSSFSKDWINNVSESRFNQYKWTESNEIQMTTIDNLIYKYGVPKFIKIDVEGYELEVLKGLSKNIEMISFEYAVPENIDQAMLCIERLYEINKNIILNFSIGESLIYELDSWLNYQEFIILMNSKYFQNSEFGDIYVKSL